MSTQSSDWWDREEDPPRPDPEVQAKLRALDEHVARARLSAQDCWVSRGGSMGE